MHTCISVVVGGNKYQKYVPMFIYFCLKSYTNVGVKIFLLDELKNKYTKIINKLSDMGDVVIKECCFSEYPRSNQELKMLRWVLDKSEFDDYNNIYVGDVDLLICRENPNLEEQHLVHCEDNKLPYSNMVRQNSKNRLSGLHFIKKDEYYAIFVEIIAKYRNLLLKSKLIDQKNETVLYNMMKESGLPFPSKTFWIHHGIHLGYWRNGKRKRPISDEAWSITGKESYRGYFKFFKEVMEEDLYKEIYKLEPLKEIKHMYDYLSNEFKEL